MKYELSLPVFIGKLNDQRGNMNYKEVIKMKWELPPDKYMSLVELKKLRKVTEDKALADMAKGRTTWPSGC